jgi:hypothetical protein
VRDLTCLELVTEAVRAALEELARTAGHALEGLAGDDWGRRYGRPARLGKNPTRPKTRMNEAGADARRLTGHLSGRHPDLLPGPRVEPLRQVVHVWRAGRRFPAVCHDRGTGAHRPEVRDAIGHPSLLSDPDCFGRLRAQRPPRRD